MLKNMPETSEYKLYYGDLDPREDFDYFYFWLTEHLALTSLGNFTTTEHFRIAFANKNDGSTISKYILFEKVEGAKFTLNLEKKTNISLSLEFQIGEMDFVYKVNKTTDENGICHLTLPYSSSYDCGNIVTDPFYKVSIEKDGKKIFAKLVVTDSDVTEGKTIDLNKQFEIIEEKAEYSK